MFAPRPDRRGVDPTRWLIGLGTVLLALGIGTAVWWFGVYPGQRAAATADAVAAGFASGQADDALFTEPVAERLTAIYGGMGELRPAVTITDRTAQPDGTQAVGLHWEWVIHEGKPAWSYDTQFTLQRGDGPSWRARFDPGVVAPSLADGDVLRATRLAAVRGAILGQGGFPLAWNQPAYRVGVDKTLTDPATAEASARELAGLLGLDADRYAARVRDSGPRAFLEARVLRADNTEEATLAREAQRWIGVRAIETTRPLALSSTFARPLLGVVAEATAEQVEASAGSIRGGDLVGRGGLQEARQHVLGGTTGFVVEKVPTDHGATELFRVAALDGTPVRTTIDVDVQLRAEAALSDVLAAPPTGEPTAAGENDQPSGSSALVAIRVSDGAVLAAASGPGSEGYSTATLGEYAPGSTFKIVSALAMLRSGATPDSLVPCTDGLSVDGYRFDNWSGYPASALGDVPLRTAFAWSCNAAFLAQAASITPEQLADAAGSLGLTVEKNLVVGSFSGEVPTQGTAVERAAAFIGQGRVVASPLGMATAAASVAAGHTVDPVLVDEPGRVGHEPATPLSEEEASALRSLMGSVVSDGTASALQRRGIDVLAKTGTASYGSPVRYHGWVVVAVGDLAVSVFLEDAPGGSGDAIAVANRFLGSLGLPG